MPSTRSSSKRTVVQSRVQSRVKRSPRNTNLESTDFQDSAEEDLTPEPKATGKKEKAGGAKATPREVKDKKPDVKIKVKKEEEYPLLLEEDSLIRRYNEHGCMDRHLPYSPDILNRTYTRQHISNHYGGSVQLTWPTVATHRIRDGIEFYACPRPNWNPHMPRKPGECGVMFFGSGETPDGLSFPMFGRVGSGQWKYYGDYTFRTSDPVSVQEWRETSLETKTAWFKKFSTSKSYIMHPVNTVTLARKIREGGVPHLEISDLEEAIARGDWTMRTSTCNCTGYNVAMQRVLSGEDFEDLEEKPEIKQEEKPVVKEEKPLKEEVKLEVELETKLVLPEHQDTRTEIKMEPEKLPSLSRSPKKRVIEDQDEIDQLPDESPSPSKRIRRAARFYIGSGHGSKGSPIEIL